MIGWIKKLINKIADMDYDEKKAKKETAALNEAYEMQIKKFDTVFKNISNKLIM